MRNTTAVLRLRATWRTTLLPTALLVCWSASVCRGGESLVILPPKFTLTGTQARQTLLAERFADGHFAGQLTDGITFSSSDPNVVRIEKGTALPVGDGRATVSVVLGERRATAEVTVVGQQTPHRWNFRIHVESVLSKTGCNSGACHGAAAGKNGFRLTLRGYDPELDFRSITRQSRGRRIVPGDPGSSGS